MINRRQKSGAQQITELTRIDSVVLIARFQKSVLPRIAYDHLGHVRLQQVLKPGRTGSFLEGYP